MARKTESTESATTRGRQLACTVPAEYYKAFDDAHWDLRKSLPQLVREALDEYAAKNGIQIPGEDEESAPEQA